MSRTKRWIATPLEDGVITINVASWQYFQDYVYQELLDYRTYVYRGQRRADWKLEPTIDRLLRDRGRLLWPDIRQEHLSRFKFATRGRRGSTPPQLPSENDWWALGQHNGLATPLLDWTTSPFVAAFFAYVDSKPDDTPQRFVFAIAEHSIADKCKELKKGTTPDKSRPQLLELFRPLSNENPRLVNQGGLFSRSPDSIDIESWIRKSFKGENRSYILIKISLPNRDRSEALRALNRMNINYLTLFPDLFGASNYCNFDLLIDKY
jgi:hypothetical protein